MTQMYKNIRRILSRLKGRTTSSLKLSKDLLLILLSRQFDRKWYVANNPDIIKLKTNPLLHYLCCGGFEGRDPNPNFSTKVYLDRYEDVRKSGMNPLVHYLKYGQNEGRSFLSTEEENMSLIRSSGLFNSAFYIANNPDVAKANFDPLLHYLRYGGFEGRDPNPNFSSKVYLDRYKDVRKSGMNPLVEYLKFGQNKGRSFLSPEEEKNMSLIRSSGLFNSALYLENNPDVAKANLDPLLHYLRYGSAGDCDFAPDFYSWWYLDKYKDVKNSGMNPLIHYIKYGRDQGRKTHPTVFKLRRIFDYAQETNNIVFSDFPEQVFIQRPRVVGSFSGILEEGEALYPPTYVSVLEDVVIFGGSSFVISQNEYLLSDEIFDITSKDFGIKSQLIKNCIGNTVTVKGAEGSFYECDIEETLPNISEGILLSCDHDHNYFHWLVECLPKLVLIDGLEQFNDVPILLPKGLHRNLVAALQRVNVNNRQVIELEQDVAYRVARLIYPSPLSRVLDRYQGQPVFNVDIVLSHKWISKVRDLLTSDREFNQKPWRKLFLSRGKNGLRKLGNQEQLELILAKRGFQSVAVDNLSLDFQIELYSQAEMIVAPTGAALTNMLFCQPGTKVIILMSNHEVTNFYFWSNLASINHLDVTTIAGERLFNMTNYWSVHDDYSIDPDILIKEIEKFTLDH